METLQEHSVPSFVRDSLYLKSLLSNGPFPDSGIEVPTGCAKKDLTITSAADVTELLKTLRFWMVPEVLESCVEFLDFAFDAQNQIVLQELVAEFASTVPFVATLFHVVYNLPDTAARVKYAASNGHVPLLRYLVDHGAVLSARTLRHAVAGGRLSCLQYLCEVKCPGLDTDFDRILLHASKNGHLHIVEYLWREHAALRTVHSQRHVVLPAAESGHLSILQFAHTQGFACFTTPTAGSQLITCAATGGYLSCIEFLFSIGVVADQGAVRNAVDCRHFGCVAFLLQKGSPFSEFLRVDSSVICPGTDFAQIKPLLELGLPFDESTMDAFAKLGDVNGVQYLHTRGCAWDDHTASHAARSGNTECLRYVTENGCPWPHGSVMTSEAAWSTSIECMKYVLERGGVLCCETAVNAAVQGSVEMLSYILPLGCPLDPRAALQAVRTKNGLECLRLLHQYHCPWDESIFESIAASTAINVDYMACVKLAHESGCPWSAEVCYKATECFEIVQYMHQNGCPLHPDTTALAAKLGNLATLEYAWKHGCRWDGWVCAAATVVEDAAHLACLQFAHENHCPWDEVTCATAAAKGNLQCLMYAHQQGCAWDEDTCAGAKTRECYEYAVKYGCPGGELNFSFRRRAGDKRKQEESDSDEEYKYSRYQEDEAEENEAEVGGVGEEGGADSSVI